MGYSVSFESPQICYGGRPTAEDLMLNQPNKNSVGGWNGPKSKHIVNKTMWESFKLLLGDVKYLAMFGLYGSIAMTLLYGFYLLNIWYAAQEDAWLAK